MNVFDLGSESQLQTELFCRNFAASEEVIYAFPMTIGGDKFTHGICMKGQTAGSLDLPPSLRLRLRKSLNPNLHLNPNLDEIRVSRHPFLKPWISTEGKNNIE